MNGINIIYVYLIYVYIGSISMEDSLLKTPNKRLKGHIMEELSPLGLKMCLRECSVRTICKSLNFGRNTLTCELSSSDAESHPEDFLHDSEYIYTEKMKKPQRYFKECNESCSSGTKCVNTASGPACIISDCPGRHPDYQDTTVFVNSTRVGTVLKYKCIMHPHFSLVSTCLPNGTWTSQSDQCTTTPACFNSDTSCWIKVNFPYSSHYSSCGGTQYIKKTNYTSAPYVGILLCSYSEMYYQYKIMLGSDISSTFYDIADLSAAGAGKDHCELVGGKENGSYSNCYYTINTGVKGRGYYIFSVSCLSKEKGDVGDSRNVGVYYRNFSGQEFIFGEVKENLAHCISSYYMCRVVLPVLPEPKCFNTSDSCWYRYDFAHDKKWNGCPDGERYIKKTNSTSAPIVGIIRCSQDRYQLYLGASKTDIFLNIGDSNGSGEDVCKLVGGLKTKIVTANDSGNAPTMKGYCQSELGQEFVIGNIGPHTGCYSNSWYQCGVSLPVGWYKYNVSVMNNGWNGCSFGVSYVRNSTIDSMPFVAAFVCNDHGNMRYKLFGGSSLSGNFMDIFRYNSCENNCDLVYGYPYDEVRSSSRSGHCKSDDYNNIQGYCRNSNYWQFTYGVTGCPSSYYWWYSLDYIECGIEIP
ncbi:uncharacterized protein LOC133204339 [Saccostrea echinata]|uniref:uncharacterized protein LOC133204339 n=1 Tax=Saccostrea echinata TaxID=191078 RepID=UPI002A820AD6|nr:uncharacterized protein LOC133204339 [Saccostrea echinata]